MPSDAKFEWVLRTHCRYAIKCGFYLLVTHENSWHAWDSLDFCGDTYSIEHVMPRKALTGVEWRDMHGDECECFYEEFAVVFSFSAGCPLRSIAHCNVGEEAREERVRCL